MHKNVRLLRGDDAVEQKVDTSVSQSNYRRRSSNTDRKLTVAVNGDDNQEIDAKVNECLETLPDGSLKCTLCGKEASQTNMKQSVRQNMTRHVATHLDGGSYSCQFCEKTFRSKNSLGTHRSIYHKNNWCVFYLGPEMQWQPISRDTTDIFNVLTVLLKCYTLEKVDITP